MRRVSVAAALGAAPVLGAMPSVNIADAFGTVGQWLADVFSSEMATFGVTIVVLTILIRSVFAVSLKKVRIFEGEGGTGLNTFGNTISWTLAILAVIGLFYVKGDRNVSTFLESTLGPAGLYAAIVIVIFLWWWLKEATGSTGWASFLGGIFAMMIANMVKFPALSLGGVILAIFGMLHLAFTLARRGRPATVRDTVNSEKAEQALANALRTLTPPNAPPGLNALNSEEAEANAERNEEKAEATLLSVMERAIGSLQKDTNLAGHSDAATVVMQASKKLYEVLTSNLANVDKMSKLEKDFVEGMKTTRDTCKEVLGKLIRMVENAKKAEQKTGEEHVTDLQDELTLLRELIHKEEDYTRDLKRIEDLEKNMEELNLDLRGLLLSFRQQLPTTADIVIGQLRQRLGIARTKFAGIEDVLVRKGEVVRSHEWITDKTLAHLNDIRRYKDVVERAIARTRKDEKEEEQSERATQQLGMQPA